MARGVQRSFDERIADLQVKLEKKQAEVTEIKNQIKEIEAAKQADMVTKIAKIASEKGISVEQLFESLESK